MYLTSQHQMNSNKEELLFDEYQYQLQYPQWMFSTITTTNRKLKDNKLGKKTRTIRAESRTPPSPQAFPSSKIFIPQNPTSKAFLKTLNGWSPLFLINFAEPYEPSFPTNSAFPFLHFLWYVWMIGGLTIPPSAKLTLSSRWKSENCDLKELISTQVDLRLVLPFNQHLFLPHVRVPTSLPTHSFQIHSIAPVIEGGLPFVPPPSSSTARRGKRYVLLLQVVIVTNKPQLQFSLPLDIGHSI